MLRTPRRIVMFYVNERKINTLDMTDPYICDCFISNMTGRHYAANFEEVLIDKKIFSNNVFLGYI